jgi:xanthine/uracil permease
MLGNLIGGFIVIVVGVNLIPTIADQVYGASHMGNVTGAASTILDLTTLFFALSIACAGIACATQALRAAGLLGV